MTTFVSSCLLSSQRADEFDHFRVVVSLRESGDEFDHFRVVVSLRESGDEFDHFRVVVSHPVSGAGGGAAKLPAGPVPR